MLVFQSPFDFFSGQAPNNAISASDFSPQALSQTLQLGNIFILLAVVAVICCWTPNRDVTRWYLLALAVGDLGHIYAVYRGVGPEHFWNFAGWNDMTWGNVGVSAFLHLNRLLTVGGLFGKIQSQSFSKKTV